MATTYDDVQVEGNVKTTTKYTCESVDLSYTIIGDGIKEDFNFLTNTIQDKLDEMLSELQTAASVNDAFHFENGVAVSDINKAYEEIKSDVSVAKELLNTLHSAFMTDIDNVNAELENNFGYWAFNKPRIAGQETEIIEEPTSNE